MPIPTNDVKPASQRKKVNTNGIDELNALNASKEPKPGVATTLVARVLKLLGIRKQPPQEKPSPGKGHFIA